MMTPEQYAILVHEIGVGKAVMEYSKEVPLNDSFWDSLSWEDWSRVSFVTVDPALKVAVWQRRASKANSFDHWETLHEASRHEIDRNDEIKEKAIRSAAKLVATAKQCIWVIKKAPKGSELEQTALSRLKEFELTVEDWKSLAYSKKVSRELCLEKILEAASTVEDYEWVVITAIEAGLMPLRRRAEEGLGKLLLTFSARKEFFAAKGRSELKEWALWEILTTATSSEECCFVYEESKGYKGRMELMEEAVDKMLSFDASFVEADTLLQKDLKDETLIKALCQRMEKKAEGLDHWKRLYECAVEEGMRTRALAKIIELGSAEN